jgi:hypothetical protein
MSPPPTVSMVLQVIEGVVASGSTLEALTVHYSGPSPHKDSTGSVQTTS